MQLYWSNNRYIFISFFLLIISSLPTQVIAQASAETDYDLQVVKFYFQKQEYKTVVNFINDLEKDNYITDSLKYYLGKSYIGLENWQLVVETFTSIIVHSVDHALIEKLFPEFRTSIFQLPVVQQIEEITESLNDLPTSQHRISLLFLLAEVYEEARLFAEANDVYATILSEVNAQEKFAVDMKIAANYIFLKNYQATLDILAPIISLQDSLLNKDALFLNYLANVSLNKIPAAKADLIDLYTEYPQHSSRFEIIQGLADIFQQQEQYITSWYLLEELKALSDPAQLYEIENTIEQLKQELTAQQELPQQFESLQPVFRK